MTGAARAIHVPPRGVPPHALTALQVLALFGATPEGLDREEAAARLRIHGPNELPKDPPPSLAAVFGRQFLSPLIYVLLGATVVSVAIGHATDAIFILVVLLLNAVIGTVQEHGAQRSAESLRTLVAPRACAVREGADVEVNAATLVPGDVVRLEGGFRVPADLRILAAVGVEADESLLTGESMPVAKRGEPPVPPETTVADRACILFAGTIVAKGRATGVVVATGLATELGRIASAVVGTRPVKPPLLIRMDRFSRRIAIAIAATAAVLAGVMLNRGESVADVFLSAVALAVSAIPEGLPVALTVALAIGARRMAGRKVIARRLVAVEALGSCTFIASDKTGTLTVNELTARAVMLPGEREWSVSGEGLVPAGKILAPPGLASDGRLDRLCAAAALCNDGFLGQRDGEWVHHGDAVDVALLVLAHKQGISRAAAEAVRSRVAEIPFEAERRFAATLHSCSGGLEALVKGAVERVVPMCTRMSVPGGDGAIDAGALTTDAEYLAGRGYRVLAFAGGSVEPDVGREFGTDALEGLTFLGLVAMIDPLRPGAAESVAACRSAGIEVAMVTGDHPATALAIARDVGLAASPETIATGARLAAAAREGEQTLDALVQRSRVFARVDPGQKLDIVRSLRRLGHFVAVTGDGANDAPALRAAHIGVAMGRRGTDVARESADLVLADDEFTSIVAGVEEGRVAYANVRKVIFLLVSTGAAEIVLFFLALAASMPLPLLPVQLLWLNLVTNGIQDVALAFEPAEGGEMRRPPRPPREPIFERVMLVRTAISAATMGVVAFAAFWCALASGWDLDRTRNLVLLMMVLFENVQAGNSRSETLGVLALSPARNRLLLAGAVAALVLHVIAMYAPGIADVLRTRPVGVLEWTVAGGAALVLAGVVDLEKKWRARGRLERRESAR